MRVLSYLFLLAQAVASAAHADCNALLTAFEKAEEEPRVAHYAVEPPELLTGGKPVFVRVGKVNYHDRSADFERVEAYDTTFVLQPLRNAAEQGLVRCSLAGNDIYRGESVKKIRVDEPTAAAGEHTSTIFWIEERSGLPVYRQSNYAAASVAWIYGDVDEPASKTLTAGLAGSTASSKTEIAAGEIDDLENVFWLCDYAETLGAFDANQEALCSAISKMLRHVKFGGDFDKMLTWWQQCKTAKHQEQEQAIAFANKHSPTGGAR